MVWGKTDGAQLRALTVTSTGFGRLFGDIAETDGTVPFAREYDLQQKTKAIACGALVTYHGILKKATRRMSECV